MSKNLLKSMIIILALALVTVFKSPSTKASTEDVIPNDYLIKISDAISKASTTICQEDINYARSLINKYIPDQEKAPYSSALDTVQQTLINRAVDECNKATETQSLDMAITARRTLEDLKLIEYNGFVKDFIFTLEKDFVSKLKVPANTPAALTVYSKNFSIDNESYLNFPKFGKVFFGGYYDNTPNVQGFAAIIDVYGNPINIDKNFPFYMGSSSTTLNPTIADDGNISAIDFKFTFINALNKRLVNTPIILHVNIKNHITPSSLRLFMNSIETDNINGSFEEILKKDLGDKYIAEKGFTYGSTISVLDDNGSSLPFSKYSINGDKINEVKDTNGNLISYDLVIKEFTINSGKNFITTPITINIKLAIPTSLKINRNVVTIANDVNNVNAPWNLVYNAIFGYNTNTGRPGAISVIDSCGRTMQHFDFTAQVERQNNYLDANGKVIGFDVLVKEYSVNDSKNLITSPLVIKVNISPKVYSIKVAKSTTTIDKSKSIMDELFGRDEFNLDTIYEKATLIALDEYGREMPFVPKSMDIRNSNEQKDANGNLLSYDAQILYILDRDGSNVLAEPIKLHIIVK